MSQKLDQLVVGHAAVVEVDNLVLLLCEVVGEHLLEVGRSRGQNHLVSEDLLAFN